MIDMWIIDFFVNYLIFIGQFCNSKCLIPSESAFSGPY